VSPILHRDWPPPPQLPPPDTGGIHYESWWILALAVLSPLVSWLVAAMPGPQPWAPMIWPAGWILAVLVLLGTAYVRTRIK